MKKLSPILLLLFLIGCIEKKEDNLPTPNKYQVCNSLLLACKNTGVYCLFGYKWGAGNNFQNTGVNAEGPKIAGGTVTYSFQEQPTFVNNHRELDVPTEFFSRLPSCAKERIRMGFAEWSNAANIQFEALADDSDSDIKIFVASVATCGNGFPNFPDSPCQELAGHVILSPNYTTNCDIFYAYVLHEIGHSLGLGHSSGDNVMGSINTNLGGLRNGDIEGIRQIYGE